MINTKAPTKTKKETTSSQNISLNSGVFGASTEPKKKKKKFSFDTTVDAAIFKVCNFII